MATSVGKRFFLATSLAVAMAAAGTAVAAGPDEDVAPEPGRLYLRFNFGLAWATMKSPVDTVQEIDASGPIFIGAIGVRIVPSLAVTVESFNQLITQHKNVGIGEDSGPGRFDTIGGGIVWTVPVIGVHLGQTFSAATLKIPSEQGHSVDTGGFSMQTMVGKDWRLTRWWLGVAGHAVYGGSWYNAPRMWGISASLTH